MAPSDSMDIASSLRREFEQPTHGTRMIQMNMCDRDRGQPFDTSESLEACQQIGQSTGWAGLDDSQFTICAEHKAGDHARRALKSKVNDVWGRHRVIHNWCR